MISLTRRPDNSQRQLRIYARGEPVRESDAVEAFTTTGPATPSSHEHGSSSPKADPHAVGAQIIVPAPTRRRVNYRRFRQECLHADIDRHISVEVEALSPGLLRSRLYDAIEDLVDDVRQCLGIWTRSCDTLRRKPKKATILHFPFKWSVRKGDGR